MMSYTDVFRDDKMEQAAILRSEENSNESISCLLDPLDETRFHFEASVPDRNGEGPSKTPGSWTPGSRQLPLGSDPEPVLGVNPSIHSFLWDLTLNLLSA
ncbi:unnamed protein product [Pleuronectes platessa]|uniref:Uncharacterized protein n=1 Tax=Pleuronectes platessa TaxID=8262 RepID=A0A9N7YQN0_PLEPL|nr:unnamed protein product [Pleuronectes platessa]